MSDPAEDQNGRTVHAENIQSVTLACKVGLEACLPIASLKAHQWSENRLADFNLWDAGIGASSTSRASLEDRLATHPHLQQVMLNLLIVYKQSIAFCKTIGQSPTDSFEQ